MVSQIQSRPFGQQDYCIFCLDGNLKITRVRLLCGHIFHETCVVPWLTKKNECPICRGIAFNLRILQLSSHLKRDFQTDLSMLVPRLKASFMSQAPSIVANAINLIFRIKEPLVVSQIFLCSSLASAILVPFGSGFGTSLGRYFKRPFLGMIMGTAPVTFLISWLADYYFAQDRGIFYPVQVGGIIFSYMEAYKVESLPRPVFTIEDLQLEKIA